MSVIWSGITEEGAVVPVQVEESGKVIAVGYPGEKGDKGDPGEEGPPGPPGEYSKGDDVELRDAYFTGKVGIRTGDPQAALDVNGQAQIDKPLDFWIKSNSFYDVAGSNLASQGSYAAHLTSNGYRDENNKWVSYGINGTTGAAQIEVNPVGYVSFNTQADKPTGEVHIVSESMIVASNGSVGIGVRAPQAKLQVEGNITAAGGNCGFTATGELFFSSRGKRWKLFVSNGICSAEEYTPEQAFQDRVERFVAPEIEPLDEVTMDNDNP